MVYVIIVPSPVFFSEQKKLGIFCMEYNTKGTLGITCIFVVLRGR